MPTGPFQIQTGPAAGQELGPGDWFRLSAEPGQVFRFRNTYRGDVSAFGGDPNPDARRGSRYFRPGTPLIPCRPPQHMTKKQRRELAGNA